MKWRGMKRKAEMKIGEWVIREIDGAKYLEFVTGLPFRVVFSGKAGRTVLEELRIQPIAHLHQVHSAIVYEVNAPVEGNIDGDGLISASTGLYLAVKVADCYPIFLMDPANMAFGVVHAGWRGSVKGIVEEAVRRMRGRFGTEPSNLIVAIGPGICGKCYEVGAEVARLFNHGISSVNGRYYLDLVEYNRNLLRKMGVPDENIVDTGLCTYEDSELFNSYRREGKVKNMWGVIGLSDSKTGR